jgi:hypothetical protein
MNYIDEIPVIDNIIVNFEEYDQNTLKLNIPWLDENNYPVLIFHFTSLSHIGIIPPKNYSIISNNIKFMFRINIEFYLVLNKYEFFVKKLLQNNFHMDYLMSINFQNLWLSNIYPSKLTLYKKSILSKISRFFKNKNIYSYFDSKFNRYCEITEGVNIRPFLVLEGLDNKDKLVKHFSTFHNFDNNYDNLIIFYEPF